MAVLKYHQGRVYQRLYGRVRRGPLCWMRDPTLKLTLTLQIPWPARCSTVRSPTQTPGDRFQKQRNG